MTPRNAFSPNLRRILSGAWAKTVHPKTRNLDASGALDVRRVIGGFGAPPKRPIARLNVWLRRYITVLTAHDRMELRIDMLCIMADTLSLIQIVRDGRSALPSMWWAYGAENCTPIPKQSHIWAVTIALKTVSVSNIEHAPRHRTRNGTAHANGRFPVKWTQVLSTCRLSTSETAPTCSWCGGR
jgi:hypothetical protein